MKKKRISNIRVGILITLAGIIIVTLLMLIDERGGFFAGYSELKSSFKTVSGLRNGAVVYLRGVDIGEVKDIYYRGDSVIVEMNVINSAFGKITKDSKAIIKTQGLLGDKMVEIIPGKGEKITEGYEIQGESEGEIYENIAQAGLVIKKSEEIVEALSRIVDNVESGKGSLGMLLKNSKLYEEVTQSAKEFHSLTLKMKTAVKRLNQVIANVSEGNSISNTVKKIEKTAESLNYLAGKLKEGKGTAGKLLKEEDLYKNLTETVKDLKALIADIKKNPKKYVTIKIF